MSTIKNLLTFGAYGRIEEAMKKYRKVQKRYNTRLKKMKLKSREVDAVLETVVQVKIEAIKILNSFKEFSVGNIENKHYKSNKFESVDFEQINRTLEKGQLALTAATGAAFGATAGVGTALATWGLASTLGAASTGTAISTLSGAAATNATLALLGGGAVAAGGGGMIAGATVLGGIVAIPALVGLGVFSHFSAKKKIAKIESEMHKMQMNMYKIDTNIIRFKEIKKKSNKLIRLIQKKSKNLKYELNIANRVLNGEMNKITSFYHQIRTTIFNSNAVKLANEISILIDTPIFTNDSKTQTFHRNASVFFRKTVITASVMLIVVVLYNVTMPTIKNYFLSDVSVKAIEKGDIKFLKSRFHEGLDPNSTDDYQTSLLTLAVVSGNLQTVNLLLREGADPNFGGKSYHGSTPLSPLIYAASQGEKEILKRLIDAGADINYSDGTFTPLIYAVKEGHKEIVLELIKNGANINPSLGDGQSPLNWAVYNGDSELIEILKTKGAEDY